AADAPDVGVQAPARAARDGIRGVARGGAATRLSHPARAADGGRCLARALSPLLDPARRCAGAPPRSDGASAGANDQEKDDPMSVRAKYAPGPAAGARVEKDGEKWKLIVVRDLRHPPARVWEALTDPAHLAEWAPFDADRNLGTAGPVTLSTVGA